MSEKINSYVRIRTEERIKSFVNDMYKCITNSTPFSGRKLCIKYTLSLNILISLKDENLISITGRAGGAKYKWISPSEPTDEDIERVALNFRKALNKYDKNYKLNKYE